MISGVLVLVLFLVYFCLAVGYLYTIFVRNESLACLLCVSAVRVLLLFLFEKIMTQPNQTKPFTSTSYHRSSVQRRRILFGSDYWPCSMTALVFGGRVRYDGGDKMKSKRPTHLTAMVTSMALGASLPILLLCCIQRCACMGHGDGDAHDRCCRDFHGKVHTG
jgi:hypothetical protein